MTPILRRDPAGADPEADIAAELDLLDAVLAEPARPVLRLWRVAPCLVVTPLLAHRPAFTAAAAASQARGWPVAVRRTGGGPVPQVAGTLNLSLAFAAPRAAAPGIDRAFRLFAGWLGAALARCGVAAETGEIAGSCCPGRYDMAVEQVKFVGIAQRRRQGSKHGEMLAAVLVHAILWLEGDLAQGIDALERFLAAAGAPERFARDRMATLAAITGGRVTAAELEAALLATPLPDLAAPL